MSIDTLHARLTARALRWHRPFWIKLLAVFGLVFTVAGVGSLTTKPGSDFPAWIEAVSTAAALCAAIVAARYASNAWHLEIRREKEREKQAQRAQAELVATWVDPISCSQLNGRHELGELKVSIRNASDLPVTNASIAYSVRVTRDSGFEVYEAGDESRAVVPPGQEPAVTEVPAAVSAQVQLLLDGGCLPQSIAVVSGIAFTDVGDRHWIREPGRDLMEQPEMMVRARRLSAIRWGSTSDELGAEPTASSTDEAPRVTRQPGTSRSAQPTGCGSTHFAAGTVHRRHLFGDRASLLWNEHAAADESVRLPAK